MIDAVGWLLISTGVVFFLLGTLALLRFPDMFTRLHALTKADNLGLGMIAAGLALHSDSLVAAVKLLMIWLLILLASASVSHLVSRAALATTSDRKRQG